MASDLSARLRDAVGWYYSVGAGRDPNAIVMSEAADLIDQQAAEIERLRVVLAEEQAKPRLKITHVTPPPLVIEDD